MRRTAAFALLLSAFYYACSLHYSAPDECRWSETDAEGVSLDCRLRTINSELESTNFGAIQPRHTVRLSLECSDALFFQSQLNSGSFSQLSELKELSIDYCKIGNLSAGSFRGLKQLRNLTVRTRNTDWSAMALHISNGAFAEELRLLERLDLSENNMWNVPDGIICPLHSLKYLNLTKNRLRDITSLRLSRNDRCATNIILLDLSKNNIDHLPSSHLSSLTHLQKLYLHSNGLSQLADRALEGLSSLHILKLSDNKLVNLPPELFSDTKDLRELYLQNNSINVVAPGLFNDLTQLLVLDLSHNELTAEWINVATFSGLVRLVVLDLSFNRITKLEQTVFRDLYSLQILRLNDNFIENIPDNIFSALYNLHTLIISNNKIIRIEADTFAGVTILSLLSLDNNRISWIHPDSLKNCTSLQDLHLNGNKLASVPDVIKYVPNLKTLDLGENHIDDIQNETFSDLKHLYGLRLTENNLGNISKGIFDKMQSLKILNLSRNKIQKVAQGAFDNNVNLQAIRLDGNYLNDIGGLFAKLPSLVWLNISDNQLKWFDYALIPTGLQWLDIHANQIEELGNYFEIESALALSTFDASSNRLKDIAGSAIPNGVQVLFLNDNLIAKVQSYTFFKKPNLTRVDLIGNQITSLDPNSLRISAVPPEKDLPEFYLANNPFKCDCTMEWLQKANSDSRARTQPKLADLDNVKCDLVHGKGVSTVNLIEAAPYQFLCTYETHCFALCHCCDFDACDCEMTCPYNCTCYHDQSWAANVVDCSNSGHQNMLPEKIPMDATQLYLDGNDLRALTSHAFIGRKRLKVLYLNNSNVESIQNRTFNGLKDLEILRLDHNRLLEIHGFEFEGLDSLRELYLEYNILISIANNTFGHLKQLRVLHINNNRLQQYELWMLSNIVNDVTISGNFWTCDCNFSEKLREWILRVDIVKDSPKVKCVFNSSDLVDDVDNLEGLLLLTQDTNRCASENEIGVGNLTATKTVLPRHAVQDYIPLLAATLAAFAAAIVALVCIFTFRQEVRVWAHSKFGVRLLSKDTFDDSREQTFDAFVSYSSKDEAWVAEVLAPALEPQYKLCLHYRDFPPDAFLADAVSQAVETSKRTIMVLSDNFLRSEWCRFEFKSAHHQVLRDRRRRLIVVLLGDVPSKELDPDIRLYLKTNWHLKWGERLFWEKLRFALPDVQTARNNVVVPHVRHHVHRRGQAPNPPGSGPRTVAIHI